MDDSVDFSTVHLNIEEVVEYDNTPPVTATFGEQIANSFKRAQRNFANFWKNLILDIVENFIAVIFWLAVIAAAAVFLPREVKRRKKLKAQADEKSAPDDEAKSNTK